MKTNEFMNKMQESLKPLLQEYEAEQSAIINDLEEQIKQRDELINKMRKAYLSSYALFSDAGNVTAPEPVESPAEDKEKASAEAKRMEEEAAAALKQAKELAEKEAAEAKLKADVRKQRHSPQKHSPRKRKTNGSNAQP